MKFHARPLGAYLALAFTLTSVLLTGVLVLIIEEKVIGQVKREIGNDLASLALQTSDKLDRGMFERYREVALISSQIAYAGAAMGNAAHARLLARVQNSYRFYDWIGMTDLDGKVLVSGSGLLEGADVSARPWFRQGMRGGYVGDVHEALLLTKLLPGQPGELRRFVDVAFPYANADGKVQGVLAAHLSWRWAADVERSVVGSSSLPSLETVILSAAGEVFLGPPALARKTLSTGSFQRAGRERTGYALETWPDGVQYVVGFSQTGVLIKDYPGLGWIVLVRQRVDQAYAPVTALRHYIIGSGLVLGALFSLFGWVVARAITRPLKDLAASAAKMQDGDLLEIALERTSYSEILTLSDTLNVLVANLAGRRQQLEHLNGTLEQRVAGRTHELTEAFGAVQASEARIRAIIEASQDAFIGVGPDGRIMDWNSQAEALLGWTRAQALGRTLGELFLAEQFRPASADVVSDFVAAGYQGALERHRERVVADRNGNLIAVEMTTCVTGTDGDMCFSIFLRDITERKKVEQLRSDFVSIVSHELRTPLTSMHASLELLEEGVLGELPPDMHELVAISSSNCRRLTRLVNDVLDLQKMDAGMMHIRPVLQPLLPLLEEAARSMRGAATAGRAQIVVDAGRDPALAANVDYDRMMQVMTNLLSNAIKFSPANGVVTLKLAPENGKVGMCVSDQGPGIPVAQREHVFEPFMQLTNSQGRAQRHGTGLGLSISKRIVEEHGGELAIFDAPGGGSVFKITLTTI
ncbi:ATP-binding protein [Massilia sp. S19_KUP03_FR1]|uniref:ATP-binding protein n=1 Tax=Massilia sp. S19_KUP03_FR1 TaxID=3025503 RepID=UPI002FCDC16C